MIVYIILIILKLSVLGVKCLVILDLVELMYFVYIAIKVSNSSFSLESSAKIPQKMDISTDDTM